MGYGVHEFIEHLEKNNYELGIWYVYKLPIDRNNVLYDKNIVEAMLATMFGYAIKMELLRFATQIPYQILGVIICWRYILNLGGKRKVIVFHRYKLL